MLGLVNTPNGAAPVELRDLPDPEPKYTEALLEVRAFSLNRGELRSFRNNEEGWVPGQDVAGVVLRPAANGEGPPAGSRVVALMDEFGWAQRAAVPATVWRCCPTMSVSHRRRRCRSLALPRCGRCVMARRCWASAF